jgi:glyoxylase-like metal-dependent hydrolase (beta-lactamase superfamily II)
MQPSSECRMMIYWRSGFSRLAAACCLLPGLATAGAIETSYRHARGLIVRSIDSMGVQSWLQQPTALMIEARGTLDWGAEHQGYEPGQPTPAAYLEIWAWDPTTGRLGREYRQERPGGAVERVREIYPSPGEQLVWSIDQAEVLRFTGEELRASRERNRRRFPPLLLSEALEQAAALRFTGRYGPFDSVQMRTRDQESLSLFFGRESRQLRWVEYLTDLPTFSDSTVSWTFSDYRSVPGVGSLPHRYGIRVNDEVYLDMRVTRVSMDAAEVDAFLDLPRELFEPGLRPISTSLPPWAGAHVEAAGDGVYRIANLRRGFHMLFVEFQDFLLAIDAPSGYPLLNELPAGSVTPGQSESAMSRHALRLMEETLPGKPLRHLVLTHFHSDHAGGLLAFAGRDIDLLASASEVDSIRAFLGKSHTLCEAEVPKNSFRITGIEQRHVIADESQRVEIFDLGASPHSAHMLVAWLPEQGILWVADLVSNPDAGAGGTFNARLEGWLDRQQIEPALILTAHGDGHSHQRHALRVDAQQTFNSPRDP